MIREPPPESTIGSDETGIYEVHRVWGDEEIGTLYLAQVQSRQLVQVNRPGKPPIDWNRDLVFDGYLRKVPNTLSLSALLIKYRNAKLMVSRLENQIQEEIEKLR